VTLSFNNLTAGQEGGIFNFSSLECVYYFTVHRSRRRVNS